MPTASNGFIVDTYNKYGVNKDVVYTFNLNGKNYCIRAIKKYNWGQPIFDDKPMDDEFIEYYIYDSLSAAKRYVNYIQGKIL